MYPPPQTEARVLTSKTEESLWEVRVLTFDCIRDISLLFRFLETTIRITSNIVSVVMQSDCQQSELRYAVSVKYTMSFENLVR